MNSIHIALGETAKSQLGFNDATTVPELLPRLCRFLLNSRRVRKVSINRRYTSDSRNAGFRTRCSGEKRLILHFTELLRNRISSVTCAMEIARRQFRNCTRALIFAPFALRNFENRRLERGTAAEGIIPEKNNSIIPEE